MTTITDNDEAYMKRCLELAAGAKEAGDIAVGCVLVRTKDGKIVSEAAETLPTTNSNDPVGHAEILAVRKACDVLETISLKGLTLYTTAEPCWMCSYVIRETGISKVLYGTPTAHQGGQTSKYPILTDTSQNPNWNPPPEVVSGLMEEECRQVRL